MILLKQYREKRGLTQCELAKRSGVPQQTICNIESGARRGANVDTLYKLSTALRCTVDDLYSPDTEN